MTWTDLTDAQRRTVLGSLITSRNVRITSGARHDGEAFEAARVVLLAAREERTTADAIADACEECGIEDEVAEDVPSFIRRLRRERDDARAALERNNELTANAEPDNAPNAVRVLRSEIAHDAIEKLWNWMRRMQDRYGVHTIYAEGKQYDLGQALVRECYGPRWMEQPPDVPTEADFARAEQWYEGEWPPWAGSPPARIDVKEPTS